MLNNSGKYQQLTGFGLKWIAIVSMVIDHIGSIVIDGLLAPYYHDGLIYFTADMPWLVQNSFAIKNVCEVLGSVAIPIFCFLIAEGFVHSRDQRKYGLRLLAFALISELPYNLAHYQQLFNPALQNVMFTLGVGVFTLLALKWLARRYQGRGRLLTGLSVLAVLAGCGLAFLVRGEYVFLGVLAICGFYLLRQRGWQRLLALAPLLVASPWVLLAAPALAAYNGQRGRGSKYFFYIFYPAHFLVLAAIAWLLANC